MSGFFDRLRGRDRGSKNKAKERLQFILVHDRISLPPEQLAQMKREILEVISKYVSIDEEHVDIALQPRDRTSNKLIAEIPFKRRAQSEDIDEASQGEILDIIDEDEEETVRIDPSLVNDVKKKIDGAEDKPKEQPAQDPTKPNKTTD
ncbi:MAG: cell division topological specificity factor MinE [Chloroflexi bacterium]|nr:MAG: cell division topological specificity factor MinE [Chloroflexota bacterium]